MAWDLDLTHGRNFECQGRGLLGDQLRHDMWDGQNGDQSLLYGARAHPKCDGRQAHPIIEAFLGRTKTFRPLYYERLAKGLASLYHPDILIPKIERLGELVDREARRDREKWGTWGDAGDAGHHRALLEEWVRRRFEYLRGRLVALGHQVGDPVNADFEPEVAGGRAPLEVTFRNLSAGKADSFEWDFGDGSTSTEREPTHVYGDPGCRTVTLKAIGPGGLAHVARRADAVHVRKAAPERGTAEAPIARPAAAPAASGRP